MNLSELRSEVRRYLAETSSSASYFSDTDINAALNEGIKVMCEKAKAYTRSQIVQVVTTIAEYKLPWQFIEPRALYNPAGLPLDPILLEHSGRVFVDVAGYPLYYYVSQTSFAPAIWTLNTAYLAWPLSCDPVLTYISHSTPNGYMYEAVVSGTSGGTIPTLPTIQGSTVEDGSSSPKLKWACRELLSTLKTVTLYPTPTTVGGGAGNYTLHYYAMDEGLYVDTDSPNFPSVHQYHLILFACFRCAMKAKNLPLALSYITEFAGKVGLSISSIIPELVLAQTGAINAQTDTSV